MLNKATEVLHSRIAEAHDWDTFIKELNQRKFVLTPWYNSKPINSISNPLLQGAWKRRKRRRSRRSPA